MSLRQSWDPKNPNNNSYQTQQQQPPPPFNSNVPYTSPTYTTSADNFAKPDGQAGSNPNYYAQNPYDDRRDTLKNTPYNNTYYTPSNNNIVYEGGHNSGCNCGNGCDAFCQGCHCCLAACQCVLCCLDLVHLLTCCFR